MDEKEKGNGGKTSKRRRWVVVGVVAVLAVVVAVACWPGEKEPEYQGKTLSEWCAQDTGDAAAVEAIIRIGTNSLPLLIRWASYAPNDSNGILDPVLAKMPGAIRDSKITEWVFQDRKSERWMTALLTFEHLGARANPAIDDLARIARKKPSSGALYCLESIGEAAFPALAKMANDSSYRGRSLAVDSIGGMEKLGTNEAAAVELLCSLSNEADQHMANNAIIALGKLALQPELALKTLVKFAGHERTSLNCNAIASIGRFGPNARPVAAQLMVYLEDKNPNVREAATNAINRITPEFFATNGIVVRERHVIH